MLKQAKGKGDESSISSAEKSFDNGSEAARVFQTLKAKLLQIEEWNAHSLMSSYALFDADGKILENEKLADGLFIRIALKGSGKYDWISVENIHEAADEFIITVKPTFDPTAEDRDEKTVSHFFTDESTNNFCLFRKEKTVGFYVIGLNEKQNTSETKGVLETVRNVAVNLATYLGMQKSEWEKFCHHFLEDVADENLNAKQT